MTTKAIIFDIDGTILDTFAQNIYPLIQIVKEVKGLDKTYDELVHYTALPGHDVLKDLGIDHEHYKRWVQYVNDYPHVPEIFEGFRDVIETLYERAFPLGLVSSKRRPQYDIDFGQHDLKKYFKHTVMATDTDKHKPHPQPLLTCLEMLGVEAKDSIYVGDSLFDYQCAKAAGAKFALATWGNISREGMYHIDFILEKPLDILDII